MADQGGAVAVVEFIKAVGDPEGRDRPRCGTRGRGWVNAWVNACLNGAVNPGRGVAELAHQGEHLPLAGWVEKGRGFIKQQQLGPAGQGTGHGQPLFLAAAEAVDRPLLQAAQAFSAPIQSLCNPGKFCKSSRSQRE